MQISKKMEGNAWVGSKMAFLLTLLLLNCSFAHEKDIARSTCEDSFDSFSDRVSLLLENDWVSFDPVQNEPLIEALGYSEFALKNDTWTVGAYNADEEELERTLLMQRYTTGFDANVDALKSPSAFRNNKDTPDLVFMKMEGGMLVCQIWMSQAPSSSEQAGNFYSQKLGPKGYATQGVVSIANAEKPSMTQGYLIDSRKFRTDYSHQLRYIWKAEVINIRPN